MAVIKIYGVRSAYSPCNRYYRLRPMAEEEVKRLNSEYPKLEHRIELSYYDDGEGGTT